ncbi:hypothetical protein MRX96_012473 [Rhipicephalus microplus]
MPQLTLTEVSVHTTQTRPSVSTAFSWVCRPSPLAALSSRHVGDETLQFVDPPVHLVESEPLIHRGVGQLLLHFLQFLRDRPKKLSWSARCAVRCERKTASATLANLR